MDSGRRGNDEWGAGMMNWPAGDGLPGSRPRAPTRGAPTEMAGHVWAGRYEGEKSLGLVGAGLQHGF